MSRGSHLICASWCRFQCSHQRRGSNRDGLESTLRSIRNSGLRPRIVLQPRRRAHLDHHRRQHSQSRRLVSAEPAHDELRDRSVTGVPATRHSWHATPGRRRPAAPPVTQILAKFVATHPSRGWERCASSTRRTARSSTGSAARSARRATNRRGDARRASKMLRARAAVGGARARREGGHGERRAGERHHLAHLRFRRHAPEDHHPPGGAGRLGAAGAGRGDGRLGPPGDRRAGARHRRLVPRRQHDVSRSTTTAAGTSRAPPARSARPRAARACWAWTSRRPRWRWASPPRSRSACASSSAP